MYVSTYSNFEIKGHILVNNAIGVYTSLEDAILATNRYLIVRKEYYYSYGFDDISGDKFIENPSNINDRVQNAIYKWYNALSPEEIKRLDRQFSEFLREIVTLVSSCMKTIDDLYKFWEDSSDDFGHYWNVKIEQINVDKRIVAEDTHEEKRELYYENEDYNENESDEDDNDESEDDNQSEDDNDDNEDDNESEDEFLTDLAIEQSNTVQELCDSDYEAEEIVVPRDELDHEYDITDNNVIRMAKYLTDHVKVNADIVSVVKVDYSCEYCCSGYSKFDMTLTPITNIVKYFYYEIRDYFARKWFDIESLDDSDKDDMDCLKEICDGMTKIFMGKKVILPGGCGECHQSYFFFREGEKVHVSKKDIDLDEEFIFLKFISF